MAYHLKTHIAVAVSLLTLGCMTLISGLALSYFEDEFEAATFSHLADSLAVTSEGISNSVEQALQTLEIITKTMPADILNNPDKMQLFLERQNSHLPTFDNGIGLFAVDGHLLAITPKQDDIIGMDFSFRDYIKVTAQTGQAYISAPVKSRQQHQHPIIMLTEPVFNEQGEMIAILGGSLDLYGNNFLQTLINRKIGNNGYYLLIDQRGTMVIHPDHKNILSSSEDLFASGQITEFLKTSRGQIKKMTMRNQEMIGVFQHVTPLDWTLIALSPLAESYYPISQARTYLFFALIILSLVTVVIVRLLSNLLISPLVDLTGKVRLLASQRDAPVSLESNKYKELGDLADSFKLLMQDVSDKRKGLKDQLAFLQNLIDTIPGPVFYKDSEFRYLGCNSAFEEYIGISQEELLGKSTFDIAPPHLAEAYHEADVDLWDQGGEQTYEATVKFADNTVHDVIFYKKVFLDTDGKPAGLLGTFLDITERKASELALVTSEKRFRLLVENAADAFLLYAEDGQILDVNQQTCFCLGYTREELLTMTIPDISVDFKMAALKGLQSRLETGMRITAEDHYRRKDGTIFQVEVRLCHTEQNGGMVIALARDVSDRKRDEEALQKALHDSQAAKQQVDNILRSAAAGLVVTDRRNRITHINQIAEEMLNVTAGDIIGHAFTKLFADGQLREQAKAFLKENDLDFQQIDFKLDLSETQPQRIIQARSSMLRTESGKPAGVVILLRDVSRERELDQIKSEFISTAAHEMRTPMSVIMGYIEMLIDSEQFGNFSHETQLEFLGEAYHKGEALSQIVDDLFDISRMESGLPLPIERSECNLIKLVCEVVDHYKRHTTKHAFKLDLHNDTKINADANKMTQVFDNLISNAVKYSPAGGEIEIKSILLNDSLRFDIEDQGCGMSADQVKRIFDKFYRADSSDTAVSGLGLGMSIVKSIVEGHDGRIWVESQVGKGTCVSLELPLLSNLSAEIISS